MLAVSFLLSGCQKASEKETEQVAISINGEDIGLREWNFYVRMNQMQWEKDYLDTYGDEMWSMEVSGDGTTLADNLREEVLDTIVQIHLTNQHAGEYGAELSEEQLLDIRQRADSFMEGYHEALLDYAGADGEFVYEKLCERELSFLTAELSVADYVPELSEEDYHREGICYVLLSTTGLRDEEGNLTPFSEEEVEQRTELSRKLCVRARELGSLKKAAEEEGLTPIESNMGKDNEGDGKEPRMLNAARLLEVGEISEPIRTEEGWFLVQHTSDYDEEGSEYWRQYLTDLAREEQCARLYEEWKEASEIVIYEEILDQVNVKHVLKELL